MCCKITLNPIFLNTNKKKPRKKLTELFKNGFEIRI